MNELGRTAYNAFIKAHGNTGPNNERAQPYEQLPPETRTAWEATARAIADEGAQQSKAQRAGG